MPGAYPNWLEVATSDRFRTAGLGDQVQLKSLWLRDIAPTLHPDMMQDPQGAVALQSYVRNFKIANKTPDEDDIIRPETLNRDGFWMLEQNPLFAKKSYNEQQSLRNVWFYKMSMQDKDFTGLPGDQQERFRQKIMSRAPARSVLFPRFGVDELTETIEYATKAERGLVMAEMNFTNMFAEAFGGLILGPLRLVLGENSGLAKALVDVEKTREWLEAKTTNNNQFLTSTAPNILGYAAGILTGPFLGLEKAVAGGARASITAARGVKFLKGSTGLLEKAGLGLGLKVPSLAYQVAGGTMVGAVQGISEAFMEGKDWKTYLARDMTLGAGLEMATRYVGMVRVIRRSAREAGISGMRAVDVLRHPFKLGENMLLSPELQKIMNTHDIGDFIKETKLVDPKGRLLNFMNTEKGLQMEADLLGYTVDSSETSLRILDKGGKVLQEYTEAFPKARIEKALSWLDADNQWEVWESAAKPKHIYELAATQPMIEGRRGFYIPVAGRKEVLSTLKTHQIDIGLDYKLDPKLPVQKIDEIYTIVKKSSAPKAAAALSARQIVFDANPESNISVIKNLRGRLDELDPRAAHIITNARTGKIINIADMPVMVMENPGMNAPFMFQNIFTGNASQIRDMLSGLKSNYTNTQRAATRVARGAGIEEFKFIDTQNVELKIRVPDLEGKTHEVLLHFGSLSDAHKALTTGKLSVKGVTGKARHIFKGNKSLEQSYDDYLKQMRRLNPDKYKKDFMPFQYVASMADNNGYYLGVSKGKYIVQDMLDDVGRDVKTTTFNELTDVIDWLKAHDGHRILPEIAPEIKPEAAEALLGELPRDPMKTLTRQEIKRVQKYTTRRHIATSFAPTGYVLPQFEKLAITKRTLNMGFSPVHLHNDIRDMTRAMNNFSNDRRGFFRKVKNSGGKGTNKKESAQIFRWMQGLDHPDEKQLLANHNYEFKADIEKEMNSLFGSTRTQQLIEKGTLLRQNYNELFARSGIDGDRFIKHYHPHMAAELKKLSGGIPMHIDKLEKLTNIPDADKKAFFELMREVNPTEVLWNEDAFQVAEIYTHLMGRKIFITSMMKKMSKNIQRMTKEMSKSGAVPEDYRAVINYVGNLFASIEGIQAPADRVFQHAADSTMQGIADFVNTKWGTNFKMKGKTNIVSTMITWSTGAHLGGRLYSAGRNLTQSPLITGSLIGQRWLLEGVDRSLQPGSIRRMEDLGIIRTTQVPVAAGADIGTKPLAKLVRAGMKLYMGADHWNRATAYLGQEAKAKHYVDLFRKNKINKATFLRRSGAFTYGKAQYNEAIKHLDYKDLETGIDSFVDHLSRLAVDKSQYLYDAFEQPQAFRGGIMKFFGQYTSWPINFYNLVKDRLLSDSLTIPQKIGFLARLGTTSAAISAGFYAVGMNPQKFAPWNMARMQGGPYYQLLHDSLAAANGDSQAYARVVKLMVGMVPFAYAGEGLFKAVQAYRDGDMWEAFLHFASSPINLQMYPRRDSPSDVIENALIEAGKSFFPRESGWTNLMGNITGVR